MPSNWLHDQVSEREMILIKDINAQDLCKGTLQGTQLSGKIGVTQQVLLISVINLSQDLISADFRFSYMYGSLHRSAIHLQCFFSFLKYKEKSDVCKHVLLKYLFWYWPPISSLTFFFYSLAFLLAESLCCEGFCWRSNTAGISSLHPTV